MRAFALGILICISTGSSSAQTDIRNVDFKNFTYPLRGPLLGHSAIGWLGDPGSKYSERSPVHLLDGEDLGGDDASGFQFESVQYTHLAGVNKEVAIVVLRYYTGGSQTTNYVYFYSLESGKPRLLDFCHTGDRAYSGLYGVRAENGIVVFDLLDPKKASGNCCSSGFVETRYRWNGNRFVRFGLVMREAVK